MSNSNYLKGKILDVVARPIGKYVDERGWHAEIYRSDDVPAEVVPVIASISMIQPGVARGPHEHGDQSDYFCFIGPSNVNGANRLYSGEGKTSPVDDIRHEEAVGSSFHLQ